MVITTANCAARMNDGAFVGNLPAAQVVVIVARDSKSASGGNRCVAGTEKGAGDPGYRSIKRIGPTERSADKFEVIGVNVAIQDDITSRQAVGSGAAESNVPEHVMTVKINHRRSQTVECPRTASLAI